MPIWLLVVLIISGLWLLLGLAAGADMGFALMLGVLTFVVIGGIQLLGAIFRSNNKVDWSDLPF